MLHFLRDRRRQKLRQAPIPGHWADIVDRNVPYSRLLEDAEMDELLRHVQVLIAEKRFEGCGGLEVTEAMKVTIAAWGAVLLLGRETDYYPFLHTILVYPESFVVPVRRPLAEGSVAQLEESEVRIGESLGEGGPGTLVLAWDEVMKSAGELSDGVNVTVHEFAHQIDEEDGALNGTPKIAENGLRERWVQVFQSEYARLERECQGPGEPLLDPYALTSAAEFFAVAMEAFVEWPIDLEAEHPELYSVICLYFRQDPATRWKAIEAELTPRS